MKLFESEKVYAFLDIGPLSAGHSVSLPTETILAFPTPSCLQTMLPRAQSQHNYHHGFC